MARSALYEEFLGFARANALLPPGSGVVAAVSGGADSVAMLDLLKRFSARGRIRLAVCHLNHKLRGEASDEDERFVARLAEALGLPLVASSSPIARLAARHGVSVEREARTRRYMLYERAASEMGASIVATAHTLSDNAETILQRLIEGTGPAGLAGIPVSRTFGAKGRLTVVRPILFATRARVEEYLAARGIAFRTDATNFEPIYTRNRIRLEVLPRLKALNPLVEEAIARTGAGVGQMLASLAGALDAAEARVVSPAKGRGKGLVIDIQALLTAPSYVAREVIRRAVARIAPDMREVGSANIEAVIHLASGRSPSGQAMLPGLSARREYDLIYLERAEGKGRPARAARGAAGKAARDEQAARAARAAELSAFEGRLAVPGAVELPEGLGRIEAGTPARFDFAGFLRGKSPDEEAVDAAAVVGGLVVRFARGGERFRPLGAPGERKLQDFFTDAKVPARQRPRTPVVADAAGIIWVAGRRIADRVRATASTREFLRLSWKR